MFESEWKKGGVGNFLRSDTLALSLFSQGGGLLPWIILVSLPLPVCLFLSFFLSFSPSVFLSPLVVCSGNYGGTVSASFCTNILGSLMHTKIYSQPTLTRSKMHTFLLFCEMKELPRAVFIILFIWLYQGNIDGYVMDPTRIS